MRRSIWWLVSLFALGCDDPADVCNGGTYLVTFAERASDDGPPCGPLDDLEIHTSRMPGDRFGNCEATLVSCRSGDDIGDWYQHFCEGDGETRELTLMWAGNGGPGRGFYIVRSGGVLVCVGEYDVVLR